jgi:hypothetical protein
VGNWNVQLVSDADGHLSVYIDNAVTKIRNERNINKLTCSPKTTTVITYSGCLDVKCEFQQQHFPK